MNTSSTLLLHLLLLFPLCFLPLSGHPLSRRPSELAIAARIVTCDQCKLDEQPDLRRFLTNFAPKFPALSVQYSTGKDPIVQFLNKYRQVVSTSPLAGLTEFELLELLIRKGIFLWTPRPIFEPFPIRPTEKCVAWRQTANCSRVHGEPLNDAPCMRTIAYGRSGYCECSDSIAIERRTPTGETVLEVQPLGERSIQRLDGHPSFVGEGGTIERNKIFFGCDHDDLTCETECDAWLAHLGVQRSKISPRGS